jgi:hypothetical protein
LCTILFLQKPHLPKYLVPMVGMSFRDFKKVHEFYNRYARHVGFGIRIGQHSGYNRYLYCSCQVKYTAFVSKAER